MQVLRPKGQQIDVTTLIIVVCVHSPRDNPLHLAQLALRLPVGKARSWTISNAGEPACSCFSVNHHLTAIQELALEGFED